MQTNEKLKALREDRDLTQENIANILGTTQQQVEVSRIRTPGTEKTIYKFIVYCRFVEISTKLQCLLKT